MRNKVKKAAVVVMSIIMVFMGVQGSITEVQAATTTNYVPITCYTIPTGRVNTYYYSNGSYTYAGYIDGATDRCVIQQVKSDGYCKVKYPVSRGYKTAYALNSQFFCNTNFSTNTTRIGVRKTVYRRSNLSQSLGTVYADDDVQIVGTSGNTTQIIYPASSGYKMGWISGKYSSNREQGADISNGYYQIKSAINNNYVLDVYGAYTDDGANIQIYQNNYQTNQGFEITKQGDGYYMITAIHSGKALDVDNSGSYNGVNVLQWTRHGGDNQKWKIVKTSDGYYSFISKVNGLYLDVSGAVAANETNVQCWTGNGTGAQKFVLQSVNISDSSSSSGAQSSDSYTTETIQITANGQTVDTFNGVPAKYITGTGNSNTGTYCCAGYVSSYYRSVYGITVANMFTGRTPSASSGYFYVTSDPKPGDIGYQLNSSNSGHWFIIKSVNGDGTYTVIEQNWKWKSGNKTYCYRNRKVSYGATKGFKVYRWSGR